MSVPDDDTLQGSVAVPGDAPADARQDGDAPEPPTPGVPAPADERQHLEACIRESLEHYFRDLDGVEPASMYEMMFAVVEKPLLEVVMRHAGDNQSRAAQWLGINRNTLRRKLLLHKLAE